MAINFPDSPSVNDTVSVGDRTWIWDGTVWKLAIATATIGGSNTQVQYNSSGSLAGNANFAYDGSSLITMTKSGANTGIKLDVASDTEAHSGNIAFYKSEAAGAGRLDKDAVYGQIDFYGQTASNGYHHAAAIKTLVGEYFYSDNFTPSDIEFWATPADQTAPVRKVVVRGGTSNTDAAALEIWHNQADKGSRVDFVDDDGTQLGYFGYSANANWYIKNLTTSGNMFIECEGAIYVRAEGNYEVKFSSTGLEPYSDEGYKLGSSSKEWSEAYIVDSIVSGSLTLDAAQISGVQKSTESFSDDDVSFMTSAAIDDRINAAAGGSVTTSDTAPGSPSNGDLWYESDTGDLFVFTDSVWVEVGHATDGGTALADADGDTLIQVEESADEDTIRFDTAGTERMVIKSDGNVGIGTATPANTLHVQKDVDDFVVKIENDGNSTSSDGLWLDTRWNTATNTVLKVTSNSGGDDFFYIKGDGKVGIGTATPTGGNLEINGGSDYGRIYVRGGGTGYTMADIRLDSSDAVRGAGVYVFNSANDTTWFSGNMYNNADAWGICRNSNVAMSQSAADTGSALVRVSSSGHMTVTNQPSFNAYVSGAAWTLNTTNGVVAFNSIRHNVGSHFSTSTYRFTAPVAGNYFFSYHFFMYTSYDNDTNTYYGFHKNGSSHLTTNHGVEGQDGGQSMSAVISLAANDYVTVQKVGGGSISSYGGQYNSFTGHLLG